MYTGTAPSVRSFGAVRSLTRADAQATRLNDWAGRSDGESGALRGPGDIRIDQVQVPGGVRVVVPLLGEHHPHTLRGGERL